MGGSFILDGRSVAFTEGQSLLEAALAAGIDVPHLCFHPDFSAHGSCKLCTVNVDGRETASCTMRAAQGMVVASNTEALNAQRLELAQMLFVEGNHFCPSCEKSGNCRLQSSAYALGMTSTHYQHFFPDRAVDASHPDLLLDLNRCILCSLCVRASRDVDRKNVFALAGRGAGTHLIVNAASGRLADTDITIDDRAAQVCPVGAILRKGQGFSVPIGQRVFDAPERVAGRTAGGTAAKSIAPAAQGGSLQPSFGRVQGPRRRVATVSLAGCFGCHMSLLDIDERLFDLLDRIELDRSPLTDIKTLGPCDIGIVEGGVCNAENVHQLREFRRQCKTLVAVGACAINGGLPAQRNHLSVVDVLADVYRSRPGMAEGRVPNDPELPLPLDKVYPVHELVHVDHFIAGCPPSAEQIWAALEDLLDGRAPRNAPGGLHYD